MQIRARIIGVVLGVSVLSATPAIADTSALAAVASNFRATALELSAAFEAETGHKVAIASGSTGLLFAQIVNGAPYDVFLSADQSRPEALVQRGIAVAGSQFTYATGALFLAVPRAEPDWSLEALPHPLRLAVADPKVAPYGAAAVEAIEALGIPVDLIAYARNVTGVLSSVQSGAVDAGLVAQTAIVRLGTDAPLGWPVPAEAHAPIRQDGVLLNRGADRDAATAFLDWLRTAPAQALIAEAGYRVD